MNTPTNPFFLTGSLAASWMLAPILAACYGPEIMEKYYRDKLYRAYWYIRDERKAEQS